MSADSNILKVQALRISFDGHTPFTAVDGIDFSIAKGETMAIVGESGSGKSLTALALMGLLPGKATLSGTIDFSTPGHVFALHHLTDKDQWQQVRGSEAGMVFQEPMSALNPIMQIGKQLAEAMLAHQNISKQQAKIQAIEWLRKVQLPNPENLYNRYPHQLSGGQKQRVMIAMAMCNHPVLLIADEPTTALDVTVQQEIMQLMRSLQEQTGTAMIFITHDLALAADVADNVLVMYKGKAVEYGPAMQVLQQPQQPYTKALIACRPSTSQKNKRLPIVADFLQPGATAMASDVMQGPPYPASITNKVLLEVNNLRVWFPETKNWLGKPLSHFKAVDGVSFTLHKGEVLGLVGESGCGKSTLSRSLIGLQPINSGQVLLNGEDLSTLSPKGWTRVRRQVQMIFQDPYGSLNPRMTVGDAIMEPLRVHGIVPGNQYQAEAKRLLDLVHLPTDAIKRYPHQFSGGQRQRIGIARALALRPQLLICDESVSALDVSVQAQILNLLKELQHEFNLSYLFISHDLSVVHYISDRVMVMQAGKIVETGSATDVLQHPQHAYTQKLIAAMPGK